MTNRDQVTVPLPTELREYMRRLAEDRNMASAPAGGGRGCAATCTGDSVMGHFQKIGNQAHDNAVNLAEGVRQAAVAAAAQSPSGQATVNAAEIVFHRPVVSSCRQNNSSQGLAESLLALRSLGVNS